MPWALSPTPSLGVPPQMLTSVAMGDECGAERLAVGAVLYLVAALPSVKHLAEVAL